MNGGSDESHTERLSLGTHRGGSWDACTEKRRESVGGSTQGPPNGAWRAQQASAYALPG